MDVFPCCEQLHALRPVPLDFCNRVVDTKKAAHRKGGAQRAVIKNCLQYISTHLREDLRLEELAHECGLCSRSLSLKFKAEVGCGIPEYIHRDNHTAYNERRKEGNTMVCDGDFYRQYLNGDDAGLEALMEKYGDPLTLYLDGYLHDIHEAEELMLDVFAYLFTKKPRIRDGGFKAYLYKAARHMALRHKSKRRMMFSLDALTDEPDAQLLAEEVIGTAERNRILHGCMGEMNPDYREVLYLTYFEGMSYEQAAEVMGKTVKQITNLVYRGKESLRKLLEREGITNAEP